MDKKQRKGGKNETSRSKKRFDAETALTPISQQDRIIGGSKKRKANRRSNTAGRLFRTANRNSGFRNEKTAETKRENSTIHKEAGKIERIIAIANQKGGVGKTTTAINLSACLAEAGKKVLVLDMDPQGNTTSGLGIEKNDEKTIYEIIIGEEKIENCIRQTKVKDLAVVPSNVNLSGAEIELIGISEKEYVLSKQVKNIEDQYDYIIIDCPPALSMLTVNALTTANSVLVPIQCEYYALEGLSQLLYTINLVKERLNPSLSIEGVVFTMYDARTNLSLQVVENVKDHLNQYIYKTIIPRNVRLAEAPSYGMPITLYDSKSIGAESYRRLAKEVIEHRP